MSIAQKRQKLIDLMNDVIENQSVIGLLEFDIVATILNDALSYIIRMTPNKFSNRLRFLYCVNYLKRKIDHQIKSH